MFFKMYNDYLRGLRIRRNEEALAYERFIRELNWLEKFLAEE
jgi:hypothetical protein